eukprot:13665484-Alexandrium_andersonii.AAC.1
MQQGLSHQNRLEQDLAMTNTIEKRRARTGVDPHKQKTGTSKCGPTQMTTCASGPVQTGTDRQNCAESRMLSHIVQTCEDWRCSSFPSWRPRP